MYFYQANNVTLCILCISEIFRPYSKDSSHHAVHFLQRGQIHWCQV